MKPLGWPLAVSSALHGGLIVAMWLQLSGDRAPSITALDLVMPEAPAAAPAPVPTRPRPVGPRPAIPRPAPLPVAPVALLQPAPAAPPDVPPPAPSPAPVAVVPDPAPSVDATPSLAAAAGGTHREPATAAAAPGGALVAPQPSGSVLPAYPEAARRAGAQGTTLLRVRVRADGSVGEVLIQQSAGHPDLDAAAAGAVSRWRFEPAERGGVPVEVWILLPVRFRLG
jgi:protein TonB